MPFGYRYRLAHDSHNRSGLGQQPKPITEAQQSLPGEAGYTEPQRGLCQLLKVLKDSALVNRSQIKQVVFSKAENRYQVCTGCEGDPDKALPAHRHSKSIRHCTQAYLTAWEHLRVLCLIVKAWMLAWTVLCTGLPLSRSALLTLQDIRRSLRARKQWHAKHTSREAQQQDEWPLHACLTVTRR